MGLPCVQTQNANTLEYDAPWSMTQNGVQRTEERHILEHDTLKYNTHWSMANTPLLEPPNDGQEVIPCGHPAPSDPTTNTIADPQCLSISPAAAAAERFRDDRGEGIDQPLLEARQLARGRAGGEYHRVLAPRKSGDMRKEGGSHGNFY